MYNRMDKMKELMLQVRHAHNNNCAATDLPLHGVPNLSLFVGFLHDACQKGSAWVLFSKIEN